jgi:hypothetical protein
MATSKDPKLRGDRPDRGIVLAARDIQSIQY